MTMRAHDPTRLRWCHGRREVTTAKRVCGLGSRPDRSDGLNGIYGHRKFSLAGDEQIPLELAERLFEAVGSKHKALRIFSREEGGFHHCQVDNVTIGVHTMFDWIADVLDAAR